MAEIVRGEKIVNRDCEVCWIKMILGVLIRWHPSRKKLDSRAAEGWFGGGDPDRTGDPRLMSPLLCQLSYTATLLISKRFLIEVNFLPLR